MMNIDAGFRPSSRSDISVQVIGDEVMLYDAGAEKIHVLNHSAYAVWSLCNGENTVEQIQEQIAVQYPDAGDELEEDMHAVIDNFRQKGIID